MKRRSRSASGVADRRVPDSYSNSWSVEVGIDRSRGLAPLVRDQGKSTVSGFPFINSLFKRGNLVRYFNVKICLFSSFENYLSANNK